MTEVKAQQFTVEPDPGDPGSELSLRKLDSYGIPVTQIAFGNDTNTYLSLRSVVGGTMTEHMVIDANGNVGIGIASAGEKLEVSGTVKATAFNGDGLNLTNLDGSQIASGTISDARLPLSISRTADVDARFDPVTGHDHDGVDSKKIAALSTTYFDSVDGSGLTNLNGSQITTGTVAAARIDAAILRTSNLAVPNGVATLDANSLVVQNPANATATPAGSKIPVADASGKLAAGWGGNASTLATLDANTRLVQSANTVWDGTAGRSASPTPAANTIPVGNASGKLASGWGGSASTLATLDASSLVVQNPANATATPAASKIPIADASGKLAAGWGGNASTLATLDANTRIVQSANTVWDGTAGRIASPTPTANTIPVGNASGQLASGWGGSASTLATLDASSLVVQDPANAQTAAAVNKIPKGNATDGKLDASWGGGASSLATLDANTRVVQTAKTVWDGTAGRSASPTPTANAIPVGNASGKLTSDWGGTASSLATLDASSLVVQNPANASATPAGNKIPIADASGKLAAGWGGNAGCLATLDANTRLVQSANTVWDGAAGRSASSTPAANTIPVSGSNSKLAFTAALADYATGLYITGSQQSGLGGTVTSTPVSLLTKDFGTVAAGTCFLIIAYCGISKGATAGTTTFGLSKSSGTATVYFNHVFSTISEDFYQPASSFYRKALVGTVWIQAAGTFVLNFTVASAGSNGTINNNGGLLEFIAYRFPI